MDISYQHIFFYSCILQYSNLCCTGCFSEEGNSSGQKQHRSIHRNQDTYSIRFCAHVLWFNISQETDYWCLTLWHRRSDVSCTVTAAKVKFASLSLTAAKRNYVQMDKGTLSLVLEANMPLLFARIISCLRKRPWYPHIYTQPQQNFLHIYYAGHCFSAGGNRKWDKGVLTPGQYKESGQKWHLEAAEKE